MVWLWMASSAMAQDDAARQHMEAILAFRDLHLSVREVQRFVPGSTSISYGMGFGSGPWGRFGGGTMITSAPSRVVTEWAVYQGGQRLTVPAYLKAIGKEDRANLLTQKAERIRHTGAGLRLLGVVGLVTGVTSTIVGAQSRDFEKYQNYQAVGIAGIGGGVFSLMVGGGQLNRAKKLTHDFGRTQEPTSVRQTVREYNTWLADTYDLTPAETLRELDRRPQ